MKETRFKETEIGAFPKDWRFTQWGDVLRTFSSGATPYRGVPSNFKGDVKWITSGELNYNVIYDTIEHISSEAQKNTNLKLHPAGTFLMAITGLEAAGTRGRCAFVGTPSTTNQSCLAINSSDDLVVEFLFWFYCFYGDKLAFQYAQGTKQQSYTAKIVKHLPIAFPKDETEQRSIATALTDIDNLLNSLDKLIAKKQAIKQGAMQQLLTGKKRLKGFSEPWVEKKLGEIFAPIPNNTLSRDCLNYSDGEYKDVHYGDVLIKLSEYTDCQKEELPFVNKGYSFSYNAILQNGDIVMADTAEDETAGKVTEIVNACGLKVVSGQHTIPLRPKIEFASKFLGYAMNANSYHRQLLSLQCGTKVTSVSKSVVVKTKLIYPHNIDEQKSIANILSDMDSEIEALQKKRDKYAAIKEGMMQQLLTGKIRLV